MPTHIVQVIDDQGRAVSGCTIRVYLSDDCGEICTLDARLSTNHFGECSFTVARGLEISGIVAFPVSGHWATPNLDGKFEIICRKIDIPSSGIGWWHHRLGVRDPERMHGQGINIGVIDTGCGDHPALDHVIRGGTYGNGEFDDIDIDVAPHGSHVCGIISARPTAGQGIWGIAAGANLVSVCIAEPNNLPNHDLAPAIRRLSEEYQCDLINLSLGSQEPSDIVREAIEDAAELGTLCICAAGNRGHSVYWPARLENTIAVSAIVDPEEIPTGTVAAKQIPPNGVRTSGSIVLARCSCSSSDINCCAPGVGIVSTHSGGGWWDSSGTSMAAPAVCGVLAAVLSNDNNYTNLPREISRWEYAKNKLLSICRSVGLADEEQGLGMPTFQ